MQVKNKVCYVLCASIISLGVCQTVVTPVKAYAAPVTAPTNFIVSNGNVPTTKILKWSGTTGLVTVELKQNNQVMYANETNVQTITFSGLKAGDYEVYLNGTIAGSIIVEPLQETEHGKEMENQLEIVPGSLPDSRILSWKGITGLTKVELRQDEKINYTASTRQATLTITKIPPGQYDVYLNGKKAGAFSHSTDNPSPNPNPNVNMPKNLTVSDGTSKNSKLLQWEGTEGLTVVIIKQGNTQKFRSQTRTTSMTIPNVPSGTFDVYINDVKLGSFTHTGDSTPVQNQVAKNVKVTEDGKKGVKISWEGTSGEVLVEVKEKGSKEASFQLKTAEKTARFGDLDVNQAYQVYIAGKAYAIFALDELVESSDNDYDLSVEKSSDTSIKVKWKGSSKKILVEIRDGKDVVKKEKTSAKVISFTELDPDTKYKLYIDDDFVESFVINDLTEESKHTDVKNLDIQKYSEDMSVDITWDWKSTANKENKEVEVSVKLGSKIMDKKKTKNQEVSFFNFEPDTKYTLLIENKEVGEILFGEDKSQMIQDITVTDYNQDSTSKMITWSGGSGNVKVKLMQPNTTVREITSSDRKVTFTNLPIGDYQLYINGKKQSQIIQVTSNQTITAPNISPQPHYITDVPASHWAIGVIDKLVSSGIIRNNWENHF
ncbi:hypothetical protein [Brevibacillus daliensis]|uniref:hypothetical protein n=1 Tax=Brevibacillus daliensis TaxID=2892995 RepID=UPI001E452F67|nr:hypothetical protein [Brevibacillus daliensis]